MIEIVQYMTLESCLMNLKMVNCVQNAGIENVLKQNADIAAKHCRKSVCIMAGGCNIEFYLD